MSEKEIAWDLSEIFTGCDDPKISENMNALLKEADEIVKKYKGNINTTNFTAQNLCKLLEKHEKILADVEEIKIFSENKFNANMMLPEAKILYNKFKGFHSSILKKLSFSEIEIGKLINQSPQLIDDESLINYKNYLVKLKRKFPFNLSESEEKLILSKDQYGAIAWQQLKESWLSSRKFKVTIEGQEKIVSHSESNLLRWHPHRETRISATKSVFGSIEKEIEIYSSALRNISGDWVKISNHRGYKNPIHQSLIDNETTQEIIDNMIRATEENIGVYQRFLKIKAKLLNLPKLGGVDTWAYLPFEKKYTWDETKNLILQIYDNFDNLFGDIIRDLFKKSHIDASSREGKLGAGYCFPWYNGKSAHILMSFNGLLSDIGTLAHELGHAVHYYLSSQDQTFFNYMPGSIVSEIGGTFGELLMNNLLLKTVESTNEKIILLTNRLTSEGAAIFSACSFMWFEQGLYEAIENGEYLDGNTISKYWCAARDKIYGDSVEWFDEMKYTWVVIPHLYFPIDRFYNYPYIYAQLFVYALYRIYKQEGEAFVPKFKKLLSAGGSLSPEELGKIVGLDITKPDFWQLGMNQYEEFVDELEKLTN
jgi:oligoendopeptidase F